MSSVSLGSKWGKGEGGYEVLTFNRCKNRRGRSGTDTGNLAPVVPAPIDHLNFDDLREIKRMAESIIDGRHVKAKQYFRDSVDVR